jgi:DNA-binding NtrC family response regulator
VRACLRHAWPGNLRELGNFVKRFLVLQDEAQAIAALEEKGVSSGFVPDLNQHTDNAKADASLKAILQELKEKAEPRIIERALIATKWNCKMAASQLKISYKALLYKMKQYRIFPPGVSGPGLRSAHG